MTAEEATFTRRRHARIRRVKQFLKYMPRKANLERYPVLRWFSAFARSRPYLWSFKISSCTPAFYAGAFIAFLPLMGVQIILAFGVALFLRANLPITVGLQAISNPFTIPFLYTLYYIIGKRVMSLFGAGLELNPLLGGMHATFLGGALIGLVAGAVLDLLYRLGVHEANKLNQAYRRHSSARKADGESTHATPRPPTRKAPGLSPPAGKGTETAAP